MLCISGGIMILQGGLVPLVFAFMWGAFHHIRHTMYLEK